MGIIKYFRKNTGKQPFSGVGGAYHLAAMA